MKFALLFFVTFSCLFSINVGEIPKKVELSGKNGGTLSGETWNSSSLSKKIYVLFYVDPDKKDVNNEFSEILKAQKYDINYVASVAVINLAATWLPNFILDKALKTKQKKYPNTLYVKDKKKVLVKQWGLKDDSSDILIFDKSGKIVYFYEGKLDKKEIKKALEIIAKYR